MQPTRSKALAGIYHQVARRLAGHTQRYIPRTDVWVNSSIEEAAAPGMATIESTVLARKSLLVSCILDIIRLDQVAVLVGTIKE
jgi:hypothetical protein